MGLSLESCGYFTVWATPWRPALIHLFIPTGTATGNELGKDPEMPREIWPLIGNSSKNSSKPEKYHPFMCTKLKIASF